MARNFYVVLGVSSDADPRQIREAYRKLVKLYHPDVCGTSPDRFLEVQEAYETLIDDRSREEHDRDLSPGQAHPVRVVRRGPPRARRDPREAERQGFESLVDEFFGGRVPGIFHTDVAPRRKNLYAEIVLEPHEAASGGLLPLEVPLETRCEACEGRGRVVDSPCPDCRGRGVLVRYGSIEISFPPGVADGTVARIGLEDIGLSGVDLVVLVTHAR